MGGMFRFSLFSLLVSHPHFAVPDPSKPGDVSFPREYSPEGMATGEKEA